MTTLHAPEPVSVDLRGEVTQFLYGYAHIVDQQRLTDWVDLFVDSGSYSATTWENARGSGLLLYMDRGREALKERAAYLSGYWRMRRRKTLHTIANVCVEPGHAGVLEVSSYFVLYRTDLEGESRLHACGQYDDRIVRSAGERRFVSHHVVLDAETLPADLTDLL